VRADRKNNKPNDQERVDESIDAELLCHGPHLTIWKIVSSASERAELNRRPAPVDVVYSINK